MHARTGQRGFTLIEMVFSSAVLTILVGSLALALSRLSQVQSSFDAEVRLQAEGTRALEAILEDLYGAAYVDANGVSYPHTFEAGIPGAGFAPHAHAPANKSAVAGEPDFGVDREIVFVLPDDADADGVPDLDANGDIVWSAEELSYVLVTRPDGINALERRTDAGAPRAVARFVERVAFDTGPNTIGLPSTNALLPFNTVQVRIWFRLVDGNGHLHTYAVQASTRLRNTVTP